MNQLFSTDRMLRSAYIDPTGRYRYYLRRIWDKSLPSLTWIMLNPSIADESIDDPTIRRCLGFAKQWGFGRIIVLNLFAWRSTDPQAMFMHHRNGHDIVGPQNDDQLVIPIARRAFDCNSRIFAAWGDCGKTKEQRELISDRAARVQELPGEIWCLGVTKKGNPRHPLYVPSNVEPIIYPKQWRPSE